VEYQPHTLIDMRKHSHFNERWVQERIADDPSLLGLGVDLIVKDTERPQPNAGRLDLLLFDPESNTRFEVEIQLGASDESHIVRTIEYWDIERRRFPQYEHVAVIVAEDITSRFLNVISLFNGFIPLVAIQMRCLELNGAVTLLATKVLDVLPLGTDEEENAGGAADRDYWLKRRGPVALTIIDQLFELVQDVDPSLSLKYNKQSVGLARHGIADNMITFHPRKQHILAAFRVDDSPDLQARFEETGIDVVRYNAKRRRYVIRLTAADAEEHRALLRSLVNQAVGSQ